MKSKLIKGMREIQGKYNAFFIDLWGVVHNGLQLNLGAIDVLEKLNNLNKRCVLISNAPRPSKNVEKFLLKLKMKKSLIKNVFTSGEAAIKSFQKNSYGENFYHLGPERDKSIFEDFKKRRKKLEEANFILCTGFLDDHEDSLEYYKNLLEKYTKLKMVCTNPDLIVHRGDKQEYCAGTIAKIFKELGGEVVYFGKPYPEIYNFCTKPNEKVLVIGDNIRTDIKGANNMKFDSLLVTKGIHKAEFLNLELNNYDEVLSKYNAETNYYQNNLTW